jgi:hypothetical protein
MKLTKAEQLQKAAELYELAEKEKNPAEKRDILRMAKGFELLAQSKRHPENRGA